ncbi:hypothetical protein AB7459_14540 [Providencia rettgeri]|uniref:hypothetical protein n=1 Tax=Providencia TaxID=586 RepID=UPI000807AAB8|nr:MULTISPECIES: hypothetical protein [Providencia]EJD6474863.1 hypothetical protein [Providencia rettgeri]ELR5287704.1 hypothetical protein [Providencia rettgeri]MCG9940281.1 hypothetical protein [Providencia rettgeri]MDB9568227.1 hypothetical protein [Providencia rettgeri]MDT5428631.1 hypothetical protein [Providencia rettgeri]
MKIKRVKSRGGLCLITLFLMVISFIFGASITKTIDFDPIEQSKINVSNLLAYPEAAEFRNMEYFYNKKTSNGGVLGYICGEVFTFNKDHLPDGFKRFIVKVYTPPEGLTLLSFPIIEGGEDALLSERIDSIWMMFCHNQ